MPQTNGFETLIDFFEINHPQSFVLWRVFSPHFDIFHCAGDRFGDTVFHRLTILPFPLLILIDRKRTVPNLIEHDMHPCYDNELVVRHFAIVNGIEICIIDHRFCFCPKRSSSFFFSLLFSSINGSLISHLRSVSDRNHFHRKGVLDENSSRKCTWKSNRSSFPSKSVANLNAIKLISDDLSCLVFPSIESIAD